MKRRTGVCLQKAWLAALLAVTVLLGACSPAELPPYTPVVSYTAPTTVDRLLTQTPGLPISFAATPRPSPTLIPPTDTPRPLSIWLPPYLPQALRQPWEASQELTLAASGEEADYRLEVGEENASIRWVFALVAPFPTVTDGVTLKDIQQAWQGKKAGPFAGIPLRMAESTLQIFTILWGEPASEAVKVLDPDKLEDNAWNNRPAWAIVPFEELNPRWKVLEVDGQSPLRKEFDPQVYPLNVPFTLASSDDLPQPTTLANLPATNRDPDKLTTVVLTGVTALVRGTSNEMYGHGVNYPAQDIGDWLRQADILHISNEVPFAKNCPAYVVETDLNFCTYPGYIGLLEDIGTDVVELTGDHFADAGPEAMLYTLEMYKERGWQTYGGGANEEEGRLPALFEHNGNKIAFLGCNAKGGGYATADENTPGAVDCKGNWIEERIQKVIDKGYLPIVTFQHEEIYNYTVSPEVREDFIHMAEAGAVIVSGSQAHQPQNFEFTNKGLIHYGLGNLFFDQVDIFPETNLAFIDRHVFYGGKYIGTELLVIRFVDMARSIPASPEDRAAFLEMMFKASGW